MSKWLMWLLMMLFSPFRMDLNVEINVCVDVQSPQWCSKSHQRLSSVDFQRVIELGAEELSCQGSKLGSVTCDFGCLCGV